MYVVYIKEKINDKHRLMKLKNIFLSTLAVLLCTACSKDEDTSSWKENADAKVSIVVKAAGRTQSKANTNDVNELSGEAKVNSLAAFVFNQDGTELIGYGWKNTAPDEGETSIVDVPAKAQLAQIVLISNISENSLSDVKNYGELEARLSKLSDQSQDNLVMSSQVITTEKSLVADDNYLGYTSMGSENINGISQPLEITRLVARLDLVDAQTKFTKESLRNRMVRIEEVRILNENTASHYFSRGYWGAVMVTGNLSNSEPTTLNRVISNGYGFSDTPYIHYVMENDASEAPTTLQVRATLLATDTYAAQTKTFTAVINRNGLANNYNHNFIKRNYVYKLHISFGDNSFDEEEDNTTLDVKVQVVSWGPVNQDVEI